MPFCVCCDERIEMQNDHSDLRQFSLFTELSDDELAYITHLTRHQTVIKDECLYLEGETSDKLYFVVEGWFKAEKTSFEGRQITLRFIGPGEMINELSIFSNVANAVSVIAMESAQVFYLSQRDVENCLRKFPELSRAVIGRLAIRIQHLLDQIGDLSLYTVEKRLARFLLAQAEENVWERPLWITQTEMAARLGTVLDVVNRHLQKLVKDGVIEIYRDRIMILDRTRLETIAQG